MGDRVMLRVDTASSTGQTVGVPLIIVGAVSETAAAAVAVALAVVVIPGLPVRGRIRG
jgi:hypothetical protein